MAFLEGIGRISILLNTESKTDFPAQYLVGRGTLLISLRLSVLLKGRIQGV